MGLGEVQSAGKTLRPRMAALVLLACLLGGGLASVRMKQDGSWDLQNYHFYNAWSFLHGRLERDVWVAGLQTYFNPLLDLPYYALSQGWLSRCPRLLAFAAGLPFGALMALVLALSRIALPQHGPVVLLATAIGLTGTTVVSVIGCTSGDIPTAILVAGGLCVVLLAAERAEHWLGACAVGGLLLGAAAGLKLTNTFYGPAMGLAVLACGPQPRRMPGASLFALAWCAAFLLPAAWWSARIYHLFGNPVFPLANTLLPSPWDLPGQGRDIRFLPKSVLQSIFYPFYWVSGRTFTVTERPLYEPRWALAYLGIAAVSGAALWRRRDLPRRTKLLLIFTAAAYIIWEMLFSIIRYAVVLEVLTGIWIVLGLEALLGAASWFRTQRHLAIAAAAVLASAIAAERGYDGGRLKRYGTNVFDIAAPTLPDGSVVVMTGRPLGFIAPFVGGSDLVFVNVTSLPQDSLMMRAVRDRLRHARAVFAFNNRQSGDGIAALRKLGWAITTAECHPIDNRFQALMTWCPAHAAP